MKTIDLHTHTTCSDGTFTPTELVEYAASKNLSAVAITDHDVLSGIEEARLTGKRVGVEVISGIEISTEYEGSDIHIVGLFIDQADGELNTRLGYMREKRTNRNRLIVERLQALGLDIDYDDVLSLSNDGVITRAHFAGALRAKGYVSSNQEAFDRYIGAGKPAYVKREVFNAEETISMINNAGGIAVMAHPLLYKFSKNRLENAVSYMASCGLRGIEAYYSTHTPSDTQYIKSIAQKYNLKISGGSDFHGANKPKLDLATGYGNLCVPYSVLEGLKELII